MMKIVRSFHLLIVSFFSNKVTGLCYAGGSRKLISASADGTIGCWDMSASRRETPAWQDADTCNLCHKPFFWNLRAMIDQKQLGMKNAKNKLMHNIFLSSVSPKSYDSSTLTHNWLILIIYVNSIEYIYYRSFKVVNYI